MKKIIVKRLVALLLVCLMVVMIAACNKSNDNNAGNTANNNNNTTSSSGDASDNSGANNNANNNANSNSNNNSSDNAGAGGDNSGGIVSARDTLTFAASGDSGSLLQIWGGMIGVGRQYQEPLVDFAEDGTPIWELATSIDMVSSSQWIVHLREGVVFSNGSKFTADDVWFTFERTLSEPYGSMTLGCFDMANSKIIDDYTIDFALSTYSIQQFGSLSQIYIRDAETFDEDKDALKPVGTGPYEVTEYVVNSHIYMKARDDYWGGKPYIENIHVQLISEDSQIVNGIEAGSLDIARLPSQEVDYVKTVPGFDVTEYYSVFTPTIAFNMNNESIMSDLNARLAVCYASDRQAMINMAYFGRGNVANYAVSEHCYDYEPRLANMHPTYSVGKDLDKAREYAELAGIVGKDIIAITNGSAAYIATAEVLQANLKEIGVNLIINNYDGATYLSVETDPTTHDIRLYAVASPQCLAVGMLYEYMLWGSASYSTWEKYDAYLELGARAVAESDMAKRSDMLYELSAMFMEATPWYCIGDMTNAVAIASDLANVELIGSGVMLFRDWYWKA